MINNKEKKEIEEFIKQIQVFFHLENFKINVLYYNGDNTKKEDKYLLQISKYNPFEKLAICQCYTQDLIVVLYINTQYKSLMILNDSIQHTIIHEFIHILQDFYSDNEQFINFISNKFLNCINMP